MTVKERKLSLKVRDVFNRCNIDVDLKAKKILVLFGVTQRPPAFGSVWTEWVPFSGGPLYGINAMNEVRWIACQLEKYRELLPDSIRQFDVQIVKR